MAARVSACGMVPIPPRHVEAAVIVNQGRDERHRTGRLRQRLAGDMRPDRDGLLHAARAKPRRAGRSPATAGEKRDLRPGAVARQIAQARDAIA